jgi:deoxycytidylate deaminase
VKDNEIFQLMDRDSGEEFAHGQHMRQAFTKADFFLRIDSKDRDIIKDKLSRFLHLIFGTKEMTPTIHETAMYLASSAAGNSACLSRQVGAALTDERGEILSVGWNDVPKFGGDLYKAPQRDNKEPYKDERCFKKDMGYCTNDRQKREVKGDIIDILIREKIIPAENRETAFNAMKKIQKIDSLLEYSRAIHAEMHAIILGAQKSGRKMVNGKLYCTTYPCHICARHIIVAGIKEVYYIEPYTKSLTTRLHSDAITEDESDQEKVRIRMFDGVSPSKFLQLFHVAPNSRKKNDGSGEALEINPKTASPRTTNSLQRLPELESIVVRNLDQRIKNAKE